MIWISSIVRWQRTQSAQKPFTVSRKTDIRGQPVKAKPAQQDHSTVQTTPKTDSAPAYATVYTFVIWDHDLGATAIYPRMATRETIARMRGKVNEDTAWVVEAAALDIEGFYSGNPPGTAPKK
jgi:hypothetical protein